MNERELTELFYKHCRQINKKKFIEIMTRGIEIELAKEGKVDLPAFTYAEDAYRKFLVAGYFDVYGRLRQKPELFEEKRGA